MTIAAFYRSNRARFLGLGRSLDEDQGRLVVPATPAWTVKDNFAHMAGAADDVLHGRLEGVTTDVWTQAQVDARADHSLVEVLDEWERLGPAMDELVESLGDAMDPRLVIDEWTHEQDVRGAVGVPGGDEAELLAWIVRQGAPGWARRAAKRGLPPLEVRCGGHVFPPEGPAEVVLEIEPYEAARVMTGRRSPAQFAALSWSGTDDPLPYLPALMAFGPAETDITDARPAEL
jgi:hypothetical protein